MNIAIVGSRDFQCLQKVTDYVSSLNKNEDMVISGGARGVDRAAVQAAQSNGIRYIEYLADWDNLGKRAGFIRNKQIVDACDKLVAFWDGKSNGTAHSINLAKTQNKSVEIHYCY